MDIKLKDKKCEGHCPICGASGNDIDWYETEVVGDVVNHHANCGICDIEFTETCEIVYDKTLYKVKVEKKKPYYCEHCKTCPDKIVEIVENEEDREWNGEEYELIGSETQTANGVNCGVCGNPLTEDIPSEYEE